MQGQGGFWDVEDWLKELSTEGDPLEKLAATVDFVMFRPALRKALGRCSGGKGGRPGFDPVLKFKMLVLQALHGLSLAQTNYMVRDRLSWMRFCGLGPGDSVPDANTLWDFREALIAARAHEAMVLAQRPERARLSAISPAEVQLRSLSTLAEQNQFHTKRPSSSDTAQRPVSGGVQVCSGLR
jgi:hypothetical protein